MPWILAGGGVVVVAIVVVLIIVLTNGSDTSSPQGVAESAVAAANDQDVDALAQIACEADKDAIKRAIEPPSGEEVPPELANIEARFELGEVTESGETASAEVKISYTNVPDEYKEYLKDSTDTIEMKKEGGDWCVTGLGGGGAGDNQ